MAQGKEWNQEEVIRTLEPFFRLGCNIRKACEYGGIPYTTVHTWISNDEELRIKITAWQHEISAQARRVWKKAIDEGQANAATQWLQKKEKDEFSERTEHTAAEGKPLVAQPTDVDLDLLAQEVADKLRDKKLEIQSSESQHTPLS